MGGLEGVVGLNVLKMTSRMMRFKVADLLEHFNFECDQAGLSDADRKVVFDAQVHYLMFITGHKDGVALTAHQFVDGLRRVSDGLELPDGLNGEMERASLILDPLGNKERVVERASEAILRQFFGGGVFRV